MFPVDSDAGGLEHGVVQRHGVHIAVRGPLFRGSHDIWKLCALQFTGGHLGRGFPSRGNTMTQIPFLIFT